MPRRAPLPVDVEPSVMKWLIDSSGWTSEELAKRLKTSSRNMARIESGAKKPTLRQLEELSKIFERPLAAFLLSEPRAEKPLPKDYRWLT